MKENLLYITKYPDLIKLYHDGHFSAFKKNYNKLEKTKNKIKNLQSSLLLKYFADIQTKTLYYLFYKKINKSVQELELKLMENHNFRNEIFVDDEYIKLKELLDEYPHKSSRKRNNSKALLRKGENKKIVDVYNFLNNVNISVECYITTTFSEARKAKAYEVEEFLRDFCGNDIKSSINELRKNNQIKLGERLRQIRLEKKMSIEDVSKTTGISKRSISRLEMGNGYNFNLEEVINYSNATNVSMDDLLKDEFFKQELKENRTMEHMREIVRREMKERGVRGLSYSILETDEFGNVTKYEIH